MILLGITVLGHFLLTCNALELVVLHTNDVHARVEQSNKYGALCMDPDAANGKCYGGVARRKTVIDQQREQHENVLLLDGGDQFYGTMWYDLYGGLETSHFMNRLGYDAMTLGNHEFEDGLPQLRQFLDNVTFPVLSCNVRMKSGSPIHGVQPSTRIKIGGLNVAIIGYTIEDVPKRVDPAGIIDLKFTDAVQSIQEEVDQLNNVTGPMLVIVLGHGGFERDKAIAETVSGVDLVIGGHSHTLLYTGDPLGIGTPLGDYPTVITQKSGKNVPVVQAYAFGLYLGRLVLNVDDETGNVMSWSGQPILLDNSIQESSPILEEVRVGVQPLVLYHIEQTGSTNVFLDGPCRMSECKMGNPVCDAAVYQNLRNSTRKWTQAAIAIWNCGGIHCSIIAGAIIPVHPFFIFISLLQILFSDKMRC